jgi:hypothetical protein
LQKIGVTLQPERKLLRSVEGDKLASVEIGEASNAA